ncbi:unnamed protein product, partial [Rotaria sp. Silwood1]
QQRRLRAAWCQYHLDWTEQDWSQIIFSDESNFELVNRKNRLYVRRYRYDQKRFERSQPRIHKGGGLGVWSCMTNYGLGDLVFYDDRLNSSGYINILNTHLKSAYSFFKTLY